MKMCLNLGYLIILDNRTLLTALFNFENRIRKQAFSISIREYDNKIINAMKYIVINLYFLKMLEEIKAFNKKIALTKVQMKVYLINNFKINMLINTDILILYQFILNYTF